MSLCPKCNEEIDNLNSYLKGEEKSKFYPDDNGEAEYQWQDFIDGDNIDFECPNCGQVLFQDEEEALKFLIKGTQKEVVKVAREL